jgi:phenylalanyl-tRNA synthetase alpha chain
MAIEKQVAEIEADAAKAIASAADEAALEAIRVAELGKKGRVSLLMRELGGMSPEQRQVAGPALNGLKDRLTTSISARKAELELAALNVRLEAEREDLTLPPRFEPVGALHPVMQVLETEARIPTLLCACVHRLTIPGLPRRKFRASKVRRREN